MFNSTIFNFLDALGGFSNFMSLNTIVLPSECLDNLCGNECCYRYHNIFNQVNSPITRGIDTDKCGFLLFLYKNADFFIYNNFLYKNVTLIQIIKIIILICIDHIHLIKRLVNNKI